MKPPHPTVLLHLVYRTDKHIIAALFLCQYSMYRQKSYRCNISYALTVFMMTSSNGNIFRVTGPLCGEFTGPGEFPTQRPVTRSFDVFFDLRLNKRLSKQPWGWWFETLSWSLWRHRNVTIIYACAVDFQLSKEHNNPYPFQLHNSIYIWIQHEIMRGLTWSFTLNLARAHKKMAKYQKLFLLVVDYCALLC